MSYLLILIRKGQGCLRCLLEPYDMGIEVPPSGLHTSREEKVAVMACQESGLLHMIGWGSNDGPALPIFNEIL